MKTCTKCGTVKSVDQFFVKDKHTGRLHTQCKSCYKEHRKTYYKEHYEKYREQYQIRALARRNEKRLEFRSKMLTILKRSSCMLCGENDIRVLEFDHRNKEEKKFSISQAVRLGFSWKDVETEIKKCDVLCSNCHKKRTSKQFGWYKEQ